MNGVDVLAEIKEAAAGRVSTSMLMAAHDAVAELIDFAKSFRAWHAENFADFATDINAQLVCLDNAAETALTRIGGAK